MSSSTAVGDHSPKRSYRAGLLLGLLAVVAFLLRFAGYDHGLPYVYNPDEWGHYVPRAVAFAERGYNPQYFVNPPAYTYLLHFLFAVVYGGRDHLLDLFRENPASFYATARIATAALGATAAVLQYSIARRFFDNSVAIYAGVLGAVAFLPVFQAHQAVNDVPMMVPATLSLLGTANAFRNRRNIDYVLAGAGAGLAIATKYTGGIVAVPLMMLLILEWREIGKTAFLHAGLALVSGFTAFFISNPFGVLDTNQADESAGFVELTRQNTPKPGQLERSGVRYYLWATSWGIGWVPAILALIGGVIVAWKQRVQALLLLPAILGFFIFMGAMNERYFARWLLPIFPMMIMLSGVGAHQLVRWVRSRWPIPNLVAMSAMVILLVGQSTVYSLHLISVLTKPDTRTEAIAWLEENAAPGDKIFVEGPYRQWRRMWDPEVAGGGRKPRLFSHEMVSRLIGWENPRTDAKVTSEIYPLWLDPQLVGMYEDAGICLVVTEGLTKGRALVEKGAYPSAEAYYAELDRRGSVLRRFSPYARDRDPVAFNYEWSNNYYPLSFERPGSEIVVYELSGGKCSS